MYKRSKKKKECEGLENLFPQLFRIELPTTVISALQAATLFEADLKYRPQIGRRDINTGRI